MIEGSSLRSEGKKFSSSPEFTSAFDSLIKAKQEQTKKAQIEKSRTPEAVAKRKAALKRFEDRTEQILEKKKQEDRKRAEASRKRMMERFDKRTDVLKGEQKGEIEDKPDIHRPISEPNAELRAEIEEAQEPLAELENIRKMGKPGELLTEEQLTAVPKVSEDYIPKIKPSKVKNFNEFLDLKEAEENQKKEVRQRVAGASQTVEVDSAYQKEIEDTEEPEITISYDNETEESFADRQYAANEQMAEEAQKAYVEAYRKYDGAFTKNKTDDQVAVTRPPIFAFGAQGKNLKKLYKEMQKLRQIVVRLAKDGKIVENLAARGAKDKTKDEINPELAAAAKVANKEADEEQWFLTPKQMKANAEVDKFTEERKFPMPSLKEIKNLAGNVKPGFTSPLVEKFKGAATAQEGIGSIMRERALPMMKRLKDIEKYFIDKKMAASADVRDFLLGPDITGWFKGKEKRLQKEYQQIYHDPALSAKETYNYQNQKLKRP